MPNGVTHPETPTDYDYASHVILECPKCGNKGAVPFSKAHDTTVEYAGVCEAVFDAGQWCGAVLTVQVTTHVFPA